MKNTVSILSHIPFFSNLTVDQLGEIEKISVHKTFNKGEVIFFEGDDSTGFFLIVHGLVKVFKVSAEGKEQILHVFGPGEPIGEVSVFSGQQFPANAEAIAESQLPFLPRSAFVDLVAANPPIALNMLAVLSKRLRQFTVQVEHLSLKEVPGRLAAYLLYLADEKGKEDLITLDISKGQLASLLGTIPETLSRIFAGLAARKLIEVKASSIRLLDRSGLEKLAERGKHGE